jgi:hypothetical protein
MAGQRHFKTARQSRGSAGGNSPAVHPYPSENFRRSHPTDTHQWNAATLPQTMPPGLGELAAPSPVDKPDSENRFPAPEENRPPPDGCFPSPEKKVPPSE